MECRGRWVFGESLYFEIGWEFFWDWFGCLEIGFFWGVMILHHFFLTGFLLKDL